MSFKDLHFSPPDLFLFKRLIFISDEGFSALSDGFILFCVLQPNNGRCFLHLFGPHVQVFTAQLSNTNVKNDNLQLISGLFVRE